jgi:Flp pilus assembly protein TadG
MPRLNPKPVKVIQVFKVQASMILAPHSEPGVSLTRLEGRAATPRKLPVGKRPLAARLRVLLASRNEGSALVEFALVVPMMMAVMMGLLTCGTALSNLVALTNAVDTGARILAVSRGETTDPCATAVAAIYAAAPQLKQANFTFTFVLNGTSYSGTTCAAGAANLVTAGPAQVTATYPAQISLFGYTPSALNMTAQTTELVQ